MLKRLFTRRRSRYPAGNNELEIQHKSSNPETLSPGRSDMDRATMSNELANSFLRQVIQGNPTYRSTAPSDLRLVQILSGAGLLICKTEDFPLDKAPRYYALSYVWGDATLQKHIGLNGNFFNITENLNGALMQLRKCLVRGLFRDYFQNDTPRFWIDALCIDQANDEDKKQQIPKMHLIYGNAERVFCWLGENNNNMAEDVLSQLFIKGMEIGIHEQAKAGDIEWIENYPLKEELGSNEEYEKFREVFFDVIALPWFSRIWCIQEAVFARSLPIFMLGDHVSAGLHILWVIFDKLEMDSAGGFPSGDLGIALIESFRTWRRQQSISCDLHSFATRLEYLVRNLLRGYKCSIPHDMIYAILSLANPPKEIPSNLKPDYDQPFADCFREYTRVIIVETGILNLLSRVGWDLGAETPSWVADFRKSSRGESRPQILADPMFSDDGQILRLQGTTFGHCVTIYDPAQARPATLDERIEDLIPGFDDILWQFAQHHNIQELKNVLSECFKRHIGTADSLILEIMITQYTVLLKEHVRQKSFEKRQQKYERLHPLAVRHIPEWQRSLGASVNQIVTAMRYLLSLLEEQCMLTDCGILVHCANARCNIALGDVVFVAKGCSRALLMRKKRNDEFQLLGTCDIIAGHSGIYDQSFFAKHREDQIWLV